MSSLEDALKAADQHAKAEAIGQADMFGVLAEAPEQVERSYANIPKWQDEIILEGEREEQEGQGAAPGHRGAGRAFAVTRELGGQGRQSCPRRAPGMKAEGLSSQELGPAVS